MSSVKSSILTDFQNAQNNPLIRLLWFVVYSAIVGLIGSSAAWLTNWNKLVVAATIVSAGVTLLIGVIEALRNLEIAHGNKVGAQALADLENEILSWHGLTPQLVATLKQVALTVAPDLLATAEGKAPLPAMPRFPGQPADTAIPTPPPPMPPPTFGASPSVMTPTSSGGPRVGSQTAAGWAYQPPGQSN